VVGREREKKAFRRFLHLEKNPSATGASRSGAPRCRSKEFPPFPPPWRAREGSTGPHRRGLESSLAGLFGELRLEPAPTAARHGRRRGSRSSRRPTSPDDAESELARGILPTAKRKTSLQTVQGGRSPLSPSLRPARPPEEEERSAGGTSGATASRVGGGEDAWFVCVFSRCTVKCSLPCPSAHAVHSSHF
jgi:hypothetical protein